MQAYLNIKHMCLNNSRNVSFYDEYFCVLMLNILTIKLRIVFELHLKILIVSHLMISISLIPNDLVAIILRFCLPSKVVTADIEHMYRQIMVNPSRRPSQTILRRFSEDSTILSLGREQAVDTYEKGRWRM